MFQTRKLTRESYHFALQRMNNRIFVGALAANIMIFLIFMLAPGKPLAQSTPRILLACCWEVTLACLGLVLFGRRLLARPHGRLAFRSIFISHSSLYALCYALLLRYLFLTYGVNVYSISSSTVLLLACMIVISTFSFDLVASYSFLATALIPIIYVTHFEIKGTDAVTVVYLGAYGFFSFLSWAIHRAEVDSLLYQQTIARQKEALTSSIRNHEDTLNSIDQIILNLGLDGRCSGYVVERSAEALGMNPNGRHFTEILQLRDDAATGARDWFEMIASDQIDFEIFSENGPGELRVGAPSERVFQVKYYAKRDAGKLKSVIMTLSDVTSQLDDRRKAEDADQRANFILASQENPAGLKRFLADLASFAEANARLSVEPPAAFKLSLHTFKGTAAMFFITNIAAMIDALELKLKTDLSTSRIVTIQAAMSAILVQLEAWKLKEKKTLLQLGITGEDRVLFSVAQAHALSRHFAGHTGMTFERMTAFLTAPELTRSLASFEKVVARVAKRTEKLVRFELHAPATRFLLLNPKYINAIDSMVHLFTNAVDHGIESPEARACLNKPTAGRISVHLHSSRTNIILTVQDDGAGLDPVKLREVLRRKGLPFAELSDREILRSILLPGFSTLNSATEISGQGVGLSALAENLVTVDGSIEIYSTPGHGTRFELTFPLDENVLVLAEAAPQRRAA